MTHRAGVKFQVPLIAILSLAFSVFLPNAAIAATITGQLDYSASEIFSSNAAAGFTPYFSMAYGEYFDVNVQAVGSGINGTVKSIQLYGYSQSNVSQHIQVTCSPSCATTNWTGTSTSALGMISFSPDTGAALVLDVSKTYNVYYGAAGGNGYKTTLYGSSATSSFDSGSSFHDWDNLTAASTTFPTIHGMYSLFFIFNSASSTPAIEETPDISLIAPCPIFGIDICSGIGSVLSWAFVVPSGTWDKFTTLKDSLKTKAPFGYFTSAWEAISGISTTTAAFSLGEVSPIMNYIFDPLRTGLTWLLYFAATIWIYKNLTNIQV